MSRRATVATAVVAACALTGTGYAVVAALTASETGVDARPSLSVPRALSGGALLARATDGTDFGRAGRLFVAPLRPGGRAHPAGGPDCERVHENSRGDGLCLRARRRGLSYEAVVYGGPRRRARARFAVAGIPDRARVSPDGRYAAYTAFLAGHTYTAGVRTFAVETAIVDLRGGRPLFTLDELDLRDGGERVDDPDANLWGVAFAGGDRFYATLASGGRHHLIAGSVVTRRARVIATGVECPSLSPAGDRIAYKRRLGRSDHWRLAVLDLASGRRTDLAERRSIDDQPEWLGNGSVVYSDDHDVWTVPADGGGRPVRLLRGASSPAVVDQPLSGRR